MVSCMILSWASDNPIVLPRWLAGTMKQYSKKASDQLIKTSFHMGEEMLSPGFFKNPYHAKVMTMLLIVSSKMVKENLIMTSLMRRIIASHGGEVKSKINHPIRRSVWGGYLKKH